MNRLLALPNRLHHARRLADKKLARPADFLVWIRGHFVPLRNPADRARHRENARKHCAWYPKRAKQNPQIKIKIGIKFTGKKVFVLKGNFFQPNRNFKEG